MGGTYVFGLVTWVGPLIRAARSTPDPRTLDPPRSHRQSLPTSDRSVVMAALTETTPTIARMIVTGLPMIALRRSSGNLKYTTARTANAATEPRIARENAPSGGVITVSAYLPNDLPFR
jgi:hypothetical protein